MKSENKDYFAEKAADYDTHKSRTQNVANIGQGILKEVPFTKAMHVLDFGSGTGLLTSQIAPHVGKITAVDVSSSMNEVLRSKQDSIGCELEIKELDLTKEIVDTTFDVIVSSMTLHHIEDPAKLFQKFHFLLKDNGIIAIADLDKEDGSFHSEDTGVHHLGFDRNEFIALAENAGFKELEIQTVSVMEKPTGSYPVFLLTGRK
jgi:2-polyprenyl-3-methyl-5-hydroxy-6-metoxy-1,4-benzoquinol methylase